jgi:hypothetical protein
VAHADGAVHAAGRYEGCREGVLCRHILVYVRDLLKSGGSCLLYAGNRGTGPCDRLYPIRPPSPSMQGRSPFFRCKNSRFSARNPNG